MCEPRDRTDVILYRGLSTELGKLRAQIMTFFWGYTSTFLISPTLVMVFTIVQKIGVEGVPVSVRVDHHSGCFAKLAGNHSQSVTDTQT